MDLLNKKIVSDPKRRSSLMDVQFQQGDPLVDCQGALEVLYVNRGRTLGRAADDAEAWLIEGFMEKVVVLFERGVIEVYDDHVYLPKTPKPADLDAISRLADVEKGRWRPG